MINLTINGIPVTVPKGTTVYTAATQLGIDIPIFCYHDRMPPFGACRVCMVEVEKMAKPQTSCTLEATEGMVVNTLSELAVKSREDILEFLLINHPLDCPICDRGGECPLQEQAYHYGTGKSRFYEEKRHFPKPVPRGPVLMLDRERCIVCARCTRFGDIVAGDHALEFIDRGFKTEVGTPDDGPAESKFIGNTIMICPVGALTSQVYRFRARPWDNDTAPSTCTLCPVGCSLFLDSRDGEIMRTRSRENRDVNDVWLCDKGWFGYEFSSNANRLQRPLIRRNGKFEESTWDEALTLVASKMQASGKSGALGGAPLTVEENYLFQQLMSEGAKTTNVDYRVGTPLFSLEEEGLPPGMEISIGDCEQLSYAILLGLDLTEEFPVIWLRLKQGINRGTKVTFIGHYAPEISPLLKKTVLHAPGQELEQISKLSQFMEAGKRGAIFVGSQYLSSPYRKSILSELMKLDLSLNIMEGNNNSMGARYAGMHPQLAPFGVPRKNPGLNTVKMLETAASDGWDFLYVAGANPAVKYPRKLWNGARSKLGFLVVQDLFMTETAQQADVVLPTLSYVEKGGSFINIEGRVQKLLPGKEIPSNLYSDAEIFTRIAEKLNVKVELPQLQEGIKLSHNRPKEVENSSSVSRISLAATFAPALFDEGVRMKHDPHVIKLVKEPYFRMHPAEGAKRRLQNNTEVTISANGNAITGKVRFDYKVAEGTVVIPIGFDRIKTYELGSNLLNGLAVEISR